MRLRTLANLRLSTLGVFQNVFSRTEELFKIADSQGQVPHYLMSRMAKLQGTYAMSGLTSLYDRVLCAVLRYRNWL